MTIRTGDVFESKDIRDTDPTQPNGLRRVRVVKLNSSALAQVENLNTGRKTEIMISALHSTKWKQV